MNPTHTTPKKIYFFFLPPNITQTSQLNPLHTLLQLAFKNHLIFRLVVLSIRVIVLYGPDYVQAN